MEWANDLIDPAETSKEVGDAEEFMEHDADTPGHAKNREETLSVHCIKKSPIRE